jgi:protein-tyrosine-phosphatase
MAEGIFRLMISQNDIKNVEVESAGIYAQDGAKSSQNAIIAAHEFDANIAHHKAKRLTEFLVSHSDEIYSMTNQHKYIIESTYPNCKDKVFLLGDGISDPFGGDIAEYRHCRDQIKAALDEIILRIKQNE